MSEGVWVGVACKDDTGKLTCEGVRLVREEGGGVGRMEERGGRSGDDPDNDDKSEREDEAVAEDDVSCCK